MIESELLAAEADRRRVVVEPAEVDKALEAIAKQNNVTVAELLAAAAKSSMDEATYRAELRRQILEARVATGWMVEETTRGVMPPPNGIDGARTLLVAALRKRAFVEVRL